MHADFDNLVENAAKIYTIAKVEIQSADHKTSCKVERTEIQYLNALPFWSLKGEGGIETLGLLRASEIAMKLILVKTSEKTMKNATQN